MDFHDNPCPWTCRNPKKNAGSLMCLGGECIQFPNRCQRKRRAAASRFSDEMGNPISDRDQ